MAETTKNEDIDEVKFNITLDNINDFRQFQTKVFFVRGNPWIINFERKYPIDLLSIRLISQIKDRSLNWVITAGCTIKLISYKLSGKASWHDVGPFDFYSEKLDNIEGGTISWKHLIDPSNGYVNDNKCKIKITVRASPLRDLFNDQRLKFESIRKCCNKTSKGEYRLIVNNFDEFFGICSPEFVQENIPWRLSLSKWCDNKNKMNEDGDFLRIKLSIEPKNLACENDWSCRLNITYKLISFDPYIESIKSKAKNRQFNLTFQHFSNYIPWNALTNPHSHFVRDNSFKLEAKIEIERIDGLFAMALDIPTCDKCGDVGKLMCPICLESLMDRPTSSLRCGHMFCMACIETSLQLKKVCPTCNQPASAAHMRIVYLPL